MELQQILAHRGGVNGRAAARKIAEAGYTALNAPIARFEEHALDGQTVIGVRQSAIESGDLPAIEALLDRAFGADRHGRTAYRLREGVAFDPSASCTARDGDALVGSLQSWPLALTDGDGAATPLWLVGPIAVDPARRGEGIARAMLRSALAAIDRTGLPAVLIGDLSYYGPFGFSADATGGWALPGPVERDRLLVRLEPGRTLPRTGTLSPRR